MNSTYSRGLAFIFEGDTEEIFYIHLLRFVCEKHGYTISEATDEYNNEPIFLVQKEQDILLVKYYTIGTIPSLATATSWYKTQCSRKYAHPWVVCLCYDTDDYKEEISKFHEGDWKKVKSKLKKVDCVIEMAACADIEDILLIDKKGIADFLGFSVSDFPSDLKGGKGKRKMKTLFRQFNDCYHEGSRAYALIASLNMQLIIDRAPIKLAELENRITSQH